MAAEKPSQHRRFRKIFDPRADTNPVFDIPLAEFSNCVVVPSLGSIISGWLLIIPKGDFLNFAQWRKIYDQNPLVLVDALHAELGRSPRRTIWFEHGADTRHSPIGCGTDHAHLHVLLDAPFSLRELADACAEACSTGGEASTDGTLARATYPAEIAGLAGRVRLSFTTRWAQLDAANAYSQMPSNQPYLVFGSHDTAYLSSSVECVESQFFRKRVAKLVGSSPFWDYKLYPFPEKADATRRLFAPTHASI